MADQTHGDYRRIGYGTVVDFDPDPAGGDKHVFCIERLNAPEDQIDELESVDSCNPASDRGANVPITRVETNGVKLSDVTITFKRDPGLALPAPGTLGTLRISWPLKTGQTTPARWTCSAEVLTRDGITEVTNKEWIMTEFTFRKKSEWAKTAGS